MPLSPGTRLGHDVTALLGEGGMRQVREACDTKLDRDMVEVPETEVSE